MGQTTVFALHCKPISAGKNFRTASISSEPLREFKRSMLNSLSRKRNIPLENGWGCQSRSAQNEMRLRQN